MNKVLIEPGIKPDEWSHVWIRGFRIILTTQTNSPELNEADLKWLNNHVTSNPDTGRKDQPDPASLVQYEPEKGLPVRQQWYSLCEKEQIASNREAERVKRACESNPNQQPINENP